MTSWLGSPQRNGLYQRVTALGRLGTHEPIVSDPQQACVWVGVHGKGRPSYDDL